MISLEGRNSRAAGDQAELIKCNMRTIAALFFFLLLSGQKERWVAVRGLREAPISHLVRGLFSV